MHLILPNLIPMKNICSYAREGDEFERIYSLGEELGKGSFGEVFRCHIWKDDMKVRDGLEYFAVKMMNLEEVRRMQKVLHDDHITEIRIRNEINILKALNHPNIIQFKEVFEGFKYMKLVMEYRNGTDLYEFIVNSTFKCRINGGIIESQSKVILKQILNAVEYMHSCNILHRDLKPENIWVCDSNKDEESLLFGSKLCIKVFDFGQSKELQDDQKLCGARSYVGSPHYRAPEVEMAKLFDVRYGIPSDCWSMGAILYVMLLCCYPNYSRNNYSGKVSLPSNNLTAEANNLISRLMCVDPRSRISAKEALSHSWFSCNESNEVSLTINPRKKQSFNPTGDKSPDTFNESGVNNTDSEDFTIKSDHTSETLFDPVSPEHKKTKILDF